MANEKCLRDYKIEELLDHGRLEERLERYEIEKRLRHCEAAEDLVHCTRACWWCEPALRELRSYAGDAVVRATW